MAKRPGRYVPPALQVKTFDSIEEIDRGIAKLQRRIEEIQALARDHVRYDDQRKDNVASNIRQTILEVFEANSPEYHEHQYFRLGPRVIQMGMSERAIQDGFEKALPQAVSMLQGLIARMQERRAGFTQDNVARVRAAFEGLELHPRIAAVSVDLYRGGHYRNAVLDGYLALENFVKEKARCRDRDGVKLMEYVFSKDQPVLAFNDLADEADRDEQRGFMHMFQGAAFGLRNPRAHSLLIDSPEEGLEYLTLLSLLANRVEKAKRVREP